MLSKKIFKWGVILPGVILILAMCLGLSADIARAQCLDDEDFTKDFRLRDCRYFKTSGINPYFVLKPGFQLYFAGEEEGEKIEALITVLRDTEKIYVPGVGKVRTRVVEEREWVDGELAEVSRNFFAICKATNSVYYFGEDVDIYEDCEIVSHEGQWRAGKDSAKPGLMMPGTYLLGSRYFQEVADPVAMDRGEHTAMGIKIETEAGAFKNCVEVVDTNPLDGVCDIEDGDVKIYCPKVGLVKDEALELVDYGFRIKKIEGCENGGDDDDDDDDGDDDDDDDDD